jgi:hypothetical protein
MNQCYNIEHVLNVLTLLQTITIVSTVLDKDNRERIIKIVKYFQLEKARLDVLPFETEKVLDLSTSM